MTSYDFSALKSAVAERESRVKAYLLEEKLLKLDLTHLQEAVLSYIKAGGKSLRPAVLMFACGAVGGDETHALPAAAAVELYHTFTLVHDDIIDNDVLRRGVPTVHVDFAKRAEKEFKYDAPKAAHYGLSVAILTGDLQQGWAASLMTELHRTYGVSAELALNLIDALFRNVTRQLINGETLDILLAETPVEQVTDDQIIQMLWQKTGVLYEFAGRAGASIGLNEPDLYHPTVEALAQFMGMCGIAFQIQDDVLGIAGDTAKLGKNVGSDVREGKRTLVLMGSLPNMNDAERAFVLQTLGKHDAPDADVLAVIELMKSCGGIRYAQKIAEAYVQKALEHLAPLPDNPYKAWLKDWSDYIIHREL